MQYVPDTYKQHVLADMAKQFPITFNSEVAMQYVLTDMAKQLRMNLDIDVTPRRAHPTDAGLDLSVCSLETIELLPRETKLIPTGVMIHLNGGYVSKDDDGITITSSDAFVGLVFPRSSNKGLVLENTVGICDDGYQGEILIKAFNNTDSLLRLRPGDRIAQYVVVKCILPYMELVEAFTKPSSRGDKGFGSSGGVSLP